MKNFKRVISAVIALALSASTLVAVSAAKFADVENTNYAEAIDVLSALEVVSGFEDGTFRPDEDLTRAQAAVLIVRGLNMKAEAEAAAGSSKFADVTSQANWATGYVNVGVAQKFITGMPDGTFAPNDNVTYAQMCVMLTKIAGYGDYAEAYGGWPTGYTTMAASAGINKGVSLADDTPLKRGQVSQMIYNTLTAPMLGVKDYSIQGNTYEPQDGVKGAFKTLLADKFDSYEADIKITGVPKSNSSLNKGEITIKLDKKAFLENKIGENPVTYAFGTVFDEAGAQDSLNLTGKAILRKDASDKWHLTYFKAGEVNKVVVSAADYKSAAKDGKSVSADKKITFGTKNYSLNTTYTPTIGYADTGLGGAIGSGTAIIATTVTDDENNGKLYINGKVYQTAQTATVPGLAVGDSVTSANADAALTETTVSTILGMAQGDITLIDDIDGSGYAGYDKIMATVYNVGDVASIDNMNGKTTIQLGQIKDGIPAQAGINTITISDDAIADGTVALTVKNKDGEAVALSSIKLGDVIAFAVDPTLTAASITPDVIDIVVTDEKIDGRVDRVDNTDPTDIKYTIGDATYGNLAGAFTAGHSYSFKLDPFGRIYSGTLEATYTRYGIAQQYNTTDGLQVILPDGSYKWYGVQLSGAVVDQNGHATAYTPAAAKLAGTTIGNLGSFLAYHLADPKERVIAYTVKNSTGKIDSITLLDPTAAGVNWTAAGSQAQYYSRTGKLASKTINDNTAIINVIDYIANANNEVSDYASFAKTSFVDKTSYGAYVFSDLSSANTASVVVLTELGKTINADSRFAVVKATPSKQMSNGDAYYSVSVLYEGAEQELLFADNAVFAGLGGLHAGDAIFFKTDANGVVTDCVKVLSGFTRYGTEATDPVDATTGATFAVTADLFGTGETFGVGALGVGTAVGLTGTNFTFDSKSGATGVEYWEADIKDSSKYKLVYGIITDVTDTSIEFTKATDVTAGGIVETIAPNVTNSETFGFDPSCVYYRYAINGTPSNPANSITLGRPTASALAGCEVASAGSTLRAENTNIYNLSVGTKSGQFVKYALAEIINGDVVAIYTITQ